MYARCIPQSIHYEYPMEQLKKFISPGAWFSMLYPGTWNEFEDGEDSFLFYNPDQWTGNFRISAYKGEEKSYGEASIRQELKENRQARRVQLGAVECAYSCEDFEEEGTRYTSHFWVAGIGEIAFECSFTVAKDMPIGEAEQVISSLEVRCAGQKYAAELIPVRLSEIYQIDEAYEWVETSVKETLKKDFQGVEEDVEKMQAFMEKSGIGSRKREAWMSLGIVLCVILTNEVDGLEWRTLVDGNREAPVLMNVVTGRWIDPMKLTWSKVKAGETVDLPASYASLLTLCGD